MLEHEVADDHVRNLGVHPVQSLARDGTELDALARDRRSGLLEHRRRDVERQHSVESIRKRRGHPARAAADFDARAAAGIRSEPAEERLELGAAPLGVTDVGVRVGRERIPGRPDATRSHALSVSPAARAIIADVLETELKPRGPYSLALTARLATDATRSFGDGVLTCVLDGELVSAWQLPDGALVVRAGSEASIERLRFVLALDDDHTEFLRRFADDPLLGESIRRLRGMRPMRVPTIAGALLRALCGQLIESSRARDLERTIVRATGRRIGRYATPPTAASLAARSPADLRRLGLHARRSATLVRLCRSLDLERMRELPIETVSTRLLRERGLGPWSLGVIALSGLGSYERGLVGDLGLLKLCKALHGRWVEAEETAELLAPYGEWQGLASVYLLSGFGRGLIPLPASTRRARIPAAA
jgi:3-methyladenine DNA glycosylase/8-oxoguanine DNA glycosylase